MYKLFEKLKDIDVNISITWDMNEGYKINISDSRNRHTVMYNGYDINKCQIWVEETVKMLYPNSKINKELINKYIVKHPLDNYTVKTDKPETNDSGDIVWYPLDFNTLKRGDIIRNKGSKNSYVIDCIHDKRIATAINTVSVQNESEWEVLNKTYNK